jgi:hypothetical protein
MRLDALFAHFWPRENTIDAITLRAAKLWRKVQILPSIGSVRFAFVMK